MLGAARAERADRLLSPPSLPRQVVGYRLGAVQADRQSRSRRRASPAEKNQHYCSGHARRIGTAGPAGGFPPASLVAILVAGRAGPTWDSCALALRDWQQFVMRRAERAHRDPGQAGHFLATRAKSDAGSVQSTMRICAAPSQLAGVPSPLGNATVGAFRPGKPSAARYAQFFAAKFLRLKCHRTCFRTRAPRDGSCDWGARLSNRPGRRARASAAHHSTLLPDATASYGERSKGRLGDVLFEDGGTAILGPSATVAERAAHSPAGGHRSGASFAREFGEARYGTAAGGSPGGASNPRPRLRRRRAGPPSPRTGGVASGRAGTRPPPLRNRRPGAPPPDFRAAADSGGHAVLTAGRCPISTRAFRVLSAMITRTVGSERTACGGARRRRSATLAC